jgi:AraC-like DNA-binding protein
VDPIASLLDGPRARGAFLLHSLLEPPWSMRIEDEAPLALVTILRGHAWVVPDDGEALRLRPGDVAIARGPDHYTVADDPATPPQVVVLPGQRCVTPEGAEVALMKDLGVRTWGNSAEGSTAMLVGAYGMAGEVGGRLLKALPHLLVVPDEAVHSPLVPLLAEEIVKDDPGQSAVLDRLLDLLLIAVMRAWLERAGTDAPGWYRARGDPVVGPALRMIEEDPGHPWTVAELAARVNASRAAFARRFTEVVGQPPMAFLTELRLAAAADLLLEPGETIGSVARRVGYGSPFALSAAFKRVRGVSPQEHRVATAAT